MINCANRLAILNLASDLNHNAAGLLSCYTLRDIVTQLSYNFSYSLPPLL